MNLRPRKAMERVSGEEDDHRRPHCLLLTYPLQGHINPMLQFAKGLSHSGVAVTLVVTERWFATTAARFAGGFRVERISDGYDDGRAENVTLLEYLAVFRRVGRVSLAALLDRLRASGRPVDCVVYNPFLPWALAVAKERGLRTAAFFTQSCGVSAVYCMVHKGEIGIQLRAGETVTVQGLPELGVSDAPSFLSDRISYPGSLEVTVGQFDGLETADFAFVNSVYELEKEVIDWLIKIFPIKTIGPTISSSYLNKSIPKDANHGVSLFEHADTCMKWLDRHPVRSVVFVSFGSMAKLEGKQMEELACALEIIRKPFLWVVRSSEQTKLPEGFQSSKEARGLGLVVPWCPQLEVLSHGAVGCMVTHCGWNSTLEGVSLGVPMVAIPWWSDQGTNAKLVTDVWKVGVRARPEDGDNGIVQRAEIARCVKHVTRDESNVDIWKNVRELKEVVRRAVDEGGSSYANIQEFVSILKKEK